MRNSFGWAEPRPAQNIIFWFHRGQKRGILWFKSSTDTSVPFASEGQGLLRRWQSVGVCLACSFCVQCCDCFCPLACHCCSVCAAAVPSLRRRWLHSHGSNHSLAGLLSVGARFAVTKTEELLPGQSLQLLQSLPMVYDRQLLLSASQGMCYK